MARVAIVTSHPIQYQAPWFRGLAKEVDLRVFFCHRQDAEGQAAAGYGTRFDWDVPLLSGYRYDWLHNRSSRPNVFSFGGCDTPDIEQQLAAGGFDACIVCGWYLKSYVQAIRACRKLNVKVLVRGDSQLATKRSVLKSALKWFPYRVLLNQVDGHLYVGAANKAYLRHYGLPETKLFFVPHFVDNDFFFNGAERARADGCARAMRERFAIPADRPVALFVGRLVVRKRVEDLIEGLARARQSSGSDVHGLVVGSGPCLEELKALASRLAVPVRFAGFVNQTQLPDYYAAADMLVLPSDGRETWGLVVNEAMACGLPAVVSDAVGCAPDLVEDGITGRVFPLGNVEHLAAALIQVARDVQARSANVRDAVRGRIANYSCEIAVQSTLRAMVAVCGDGREPAVAIR